MNIGNRRQSTRKYLKLFVAFTVVAATMLGADPASAATPEITFPVAPEAKDKVYWRDTYGAARSGGRSHIGVDMMGPKMVPLVAAADGYVSWSRFSNSTGTLLRIQGDNGWSYQYIHLNNDTPGTDDGSAKCSQAFSARLCANMSGNQIIRGTRVSAGEVIGYLGDSGNAENTGAHLHFEIYQPNGSAINPTSAVDEAFARLTQPTVVIPKEKLGPWASGYELSNRSYQALHGRNANTTEVNAIARRIADEGSWEVLADFIEDENTAGASITRLYRAFFHRSPDTTGYRYWLNQRVRGISLEAIAEQFALSEEFRIRYANQSSDQFISSLYENVLGRTPDSQGKSYWLNRINRGAVTKGTMVVYFSEGVEMRQRFGSRTEGTTAWLVFKNKTPTDAELNAWQNQAASTALKTQLQRNFS